MARSLATQEATVARSTATPLLAAADSFDRSRWDLKPSTKQGYRKTFVRFAKYGVTLVDRCVN